MLHATAGGGVVGVVAQDFLEFLDGVVVLAQILEGVGLLQAAFHILHALHVIRCQGWRVAVWIFQTLLKSQCAAVAGAGVESFLEQFAGFLVTAGLGTILGEGHASIRILGSRKRAPFRRGRGIGDGFKGRLVLIQSTFCITFRKQLVTFFDGLAGIFHSRRTSGDFSFCDSREGARAASRACKGRERGRGGHCCGKQCDVCAAHKTFESCHREAAGDITEIRDSVK